MNKTTPTDSCLTPISYSDARKRYPVKIQKTTGKISKSQPVNLWEGITENTPLVELRLHRGFVDLMWERDDGVRVYIGSRKEVLTNK